MFKPLFALLLSFFLFAACDSADTVRINQNFQIEVMDGGAMVADGQFSFPEPEAGASTTGSFTLETPSGDPLSPVTITTGSLTATLASDGEIQVYILDPSVSDSGLRFDGDYDNSGFSGMWGTITIVGYTEQGIFTADAN